MKGTLRSTAWLVLVLCVGCDSPPVERSCAGETVMLCGAREYAEIRTATFEPQGLTIADFDQRAQIRIELDRCADAPAAHAVTISALLPGDAGSEAAVLPLLTVTDGVDGDMTPRDGVIEVDVANPFLASVPAETDIRLRFVTRSTTPGGCTGGDFELPYRTGPRRM